jgi:transposase
MFSINASQQFYMCTSATDMRKGFDGLCGLVSGQMGRNPLSGEVFIFINKTRTVIKLLHWERGGLVIYHKRLESGRFSLPLYDNEKRSYCILWHDLVLMTAGISIEKVSRQKRFEPAV